MPTYGIKESSVYLGVAPSTLRWWFFGKPARNEQKGYEPIFSGADPEAGLLSFFNLIEAHILSSLREDYTKLRTNSVRRALEHVRSLSPEKRHPLVTELFYTNEKELFVKILEDEDNANTRTVNASKGGQTLIASMDEHLRLIEYDKGWAYKLFPIPGNKVIVLNPTVSAGRPTISGTGVLASIIRQRARAGETPEDLARDYNVTVPEIEKAIEFIQAA